MERTGDPWILQQVGSINVEGRQEGYKTHIKPAAGDLHNNFYILLARNCISGPTIITHFFPPEYLDCEFPAKYQITIRDNVTNHVAVMTNTPMASNLQYLPSCRFSKRSTACRQFLQRFSCYMEPFLHFLQAISYFQTFMEFHNSNLRPDSQAQQVIIYN